MTRCSDLALIWFRGDNATTGSGCDGESGDVSQPITVCSHSQVTFSAANGSWLRELCSSETSRVNFKERLCRYIASQVHSL